MIIRITGTTLMSRHKNRETIILSGVLYVFRRTVYSTLLILLRT